MTGMSPLDTHLVHLYNDKVEEQDYLSPLLKEGMLLSVPYEDERQRWKSNINTLVSSKPRTISKNDSEFVFEENDILQLHARGRARLSASKSGIPSSIDKIPAGEQGAQFGGQKRKYDSIQNLPSERIAGPTPSSSTWESRSGGSSAAQPPTFGGKGLWPTLQPPPSSSTDRAPQEQRPSAPVRKYAQGPDHQQQQQQSSVTVGPNRGLNSAQTPNSGPFRTARDELISQNIKKFGHAGNAAYPPPQGNSAPKRSLGPRRGGVFNKFVAPKKVDEENNALMYDNDESGKEELQDERLRNIDPKMVEMIMNEIMYVGKPVEWNDIAGLDFAKKTIQEIVVWPLLRPDIFTGLRGPPKGILLFGPPGTGKTLIGKCIAAQSRSTFFSISASCLTSKWVGEGEKMVRALFAVARCHQPAVVFIDEIDSLLSQRSDTEHESSRRIKTEFLVQLDGATTAEDERILVVGATNRPQELDEAARRRLVKRLYIPLPEAEARAQMVRHLMAQQRCTLTETDIEQVARMAEGFSGADMRDLCREASYGPIRSIDMMQMEHIDPEQVRPVTLQDFEVALRQVRPSVSSKDLQSYDDWNSTYGYGKS